LIEQEPVWSALGSGISLIVPALRALQRLGVLDDCLESGYVVETIEICDEQSEIVHVARLPRPDEKSLPGLLGLMRPRLHDIFAAAAKEEGVDVRLGTTVVSVEEDEDGTLAIETSDGGTDEYDVLVAADGLHSKTRDLVTEPATPHFRGQVIFRALVDKPREVKAAGQFMGSADVHAGFTPTGPESAYMFCLTPGDLQTRVTPEEAPGLMRERLAGFGGLAAEMRETIGPDSAVDYRPLETLLLPPPTSRGNMVVLGDAAHATTPQLAAGASMCLEDALVLGEELDREVPVAEALAAFSARRWPRASFVVERSIALSDAQLRSDTARHSELFDEAVGVLAEEY
jgi:2-polyprenyl-6-methoxyphenol hydroxylase-like FAD-dependent oxidoreductase